MCKFSSKTSDQVSEPPANLLSTTVKTKNNEGNSKLPLGYRTRIVISSILCKNLGLRSGLYDQIVSLRTQRVKRYRPMKAQLEKKLSKFSCNRARQQTSTMLNWQGKCNGTSQKSFHDENVYHNTDLREECETLPSLLFV